VVDHKLGARVRVGPLDAGDHLADLTIICPDNARAGIKDEFRHIVDVPTLVGLREEEQTYAEGVVSVRHEAMVGGLDLPPDEILRFSRLARRVDRSVLVHGEARSALRKRITGNRHVDHEPILGDPRRPSEHVVPSCSVGRRRKFDQRNVDHERGQSSANCPAFGRNVYRATLER
jgi:hypothetical protein